MSGFIEQSEGRTNARGKEESKACLPWIEVEGDSSGNGGGVDGVAARCISWIKKVIYLAVSR